MYTCTRALFAESVFIYCDFYLLSVCVYIVWFLFMFQQTRSSANCVKNIQSKCHFLLAHLDIGWHKNAKNIGSCIARTRSIFTFTFTAATIMMMAFSILLRFMFSAEIFSDFRRGIYSQTSNERDFSVNDWPLNLMTKHIRNNDNYNCRQFSRRDSDAVLWSHT